MTPLKIDRLRRDRDRAVVERLEAVERAERAEARYWAIERELAQVFEEVLEVLHDAQAPQDATPYPPGSLPR